MPKSSNLVLIGDSTIDNYHWVGEGDTLEDKLKDELGESQVHNLAVDGFTTHDVLAGGDRGKAVRDDKHVGGEYDYPLDMLHAVKDPSHMLISVGGNNVREYLGSLINTAPEQREAKLSDILEKLKKEYIQIIERTKQIKPNAKSVLMLQYTPLLANDLYSIYFLMDLLQNKQKMSLWTGVQFGFYKAFGFLHTASKLNALKKLHEIMATVYQPILQYAKEQNIPVIDLASTLDYNDNRFYRAQIEPSAKGGHAIAELITHVITNHDYEAGAKLYSRPGCDNGDIISMDMPDDWQPHHAPQSKEEAKAMFLTTYHKAYDRDAHCFFGLKSLWAKSHMNDDKNIDEIIAHAQGKSKNGTGERSFNVMQMLGWLNEDKTINEHSGLQACLRTTPS